MSPGSTSSTGGSARSRSRSIPGTRRTCGAASPPASRTEWLEPAAAQAAHPALGTIAGALLTPTHGYVAAAPLATALAAAAERHGATFRRAAVTGVVSRGSSIRVTTTDGELDAAQVVHRRRRLG